MDQLPIPFAMEASLWSARAVVVAAHALVYVGLRRFLSERRVAHAVSLAAAAAVAGLTLACGSELLKLDVKLLGAGRDPAAWRLVASVWTAGVIGASSIYALFWIWRKSAARGRRLSEPLSPSEPGRRELLANLGRAALAAPFAVAGYGTYIGRTHFEVIETELAVPDLPADLDGLKLVQVTDIHAGPYLSTPEMERILAMANETKPDIALVTGDLVTQVGDPLEKCIDIFSGLKADAGVWGCLGNHERYCEAEEFVVDYARRRGIHFLRRQAEALRFGEAKLNLVGVDYQRQHRPYLRGAEQWVDPQAFNLLLSHNPDVFPRAAALGYDLIVAGHTHGGQVTVEIIEQHVNAGRFFTPFVAGKYSRGDSLLYVSRGVGTVNLPIRIGALPEISLLRLRRA